MYDNTFGSFYYYNGTTWAALSSSANAPWSLTGNAGTNAASFVGTTDNQPLKFRVNNTAAGIVSIGTLGNTALGINALPNSTGSNNTAFGSSASEANTTGTGNTSVGFVALASNTTGSFNAALGRYPLILNTTGSSNTAIGNAALFYNTSGNSNTAFGARSLFSNSTGSNLVAVGDSALYSNGSGATMPYEGIANTAIGSKALFANTTGSYNTGTGAEALFNNTTGVQNTANGWSALYNNTGSNNTASGSESLNSNTTGFQNTADGAISMSYNTTGYSNTAHGQSTLLLNAEGYDNTAVGQAALSPDFAVSAPHRNSAVGYFSGKMAYSTWGDGYYSILGSYNTFVGLYAHGEVMNETYTSNSASLGCNSAFNSSNGIVIVVVQAGYVFTDWIGGQVGWSTASDRRFKTNIQNTNLGLGFILKLRPVNYEMIGKDTKLGENDHNKQRFTGFIAQEVEAAAGELGTEFPAVCKPASDKDFYSLRYAEFTVPLVKAVQERQALIAAQQAEIDQLKAQQANYDDLERELVAVKGFVRALLKQGQDERK